MSTTFNCPACGKTIAAEVTIGTQVQCPLCNQVVTVPGDASPTAPMPEQTADRPVPPGGAAAQVGYATVTGRSVSQGLAIAALVCGIVGLVGCAPVGIVGLVLGIIALVRVNRDPRRYGGKGMAIGGICTGALSILLVPMMIAILLPSLSRARELSKRQVCMARMSAIGQALYTYAQDDPQMFPELGADWQARLIDAGYCSPQQFLCPSDSRMTGSSYYYVPGYSTTSDPTQIILYEDPANHGGEGGNILYQDAHVAFVRSPEYEEEIDSITLPDGTPWAPHKSP